MIPSAHGKHDKFSSNYSLFVEKISKTMLQVQVSITTHDL